MSVYQVTREQRINVLKAIDKTPESFEADVKILREWMKTQPHLPEIMSDVMIGNFIILNKGSVEITKKKIDMYYTIRSLIPEIFENLNPKLPENINYRNCGKMVPFPKLTPELRRVIYVGAHSKESMKSMDLLRFYALVFASVEVRMHKDYCLGTIQVIDCDGFTFSDLKKVTPSLIKKSVAIGEKVYSIPVKGIYFINSPPVIAHVTSILKRILKPKIFDRVKVFEDAQPLKELFPAEILPEDFGGKEISLQKLWELTLKEMDELQDRFDKLDQLKVDESLRPEKLQDDDILGYYGNFKELDVD